MSIALLSQAGESGRHLRDALVESGNPLVYESQAADFDRDALEKSGARVVVVNLDSETEAHLDDVYALLDDERYNVVFNEAQVSSQLSGWEQARWARHLVAKILGTGNSDPPRPEGAEPVPQPVAKSIQSEPVQAADALTDDMIVVEALPEAEAADAIEEIEMSETAVEVPDSLVHNDIDEDPFADIAALLVESEANPIVDVGIESAGSAARSFSANETLPMPALDLSEFDDFADESIPDLTFGNDDSTNSDSDLDVFDADATIEMRAFDASSESVEASLGFGDLDDFADADEASDASIEVIEIYSAPAPASLSIDSELAGAIEDAEAAATGSELSDLQLLDLDWTDPAEKPDREKTESTEDVKIPEVASAFAWSLASLDDEVEETAGDNRSATGKATFGIETISAAEYLTPDAESTGDESIEAEMSLELIPIEEAVAPHSGGKTGDTTSESWLDTENKVVITRVWVLGASIGGPEAVREFLADIPAKCPALFLLAQHMGAEFMDIMAQQLVRSTRLTVRTPSHGERVGHGDILIVPTTHRLRVDRAGVVTLEAHAAGDRPNSPSIDQVLQDVADRFGGQAGAIIFSGMAEDAAEGSRYLTEIGGTVYAQDPETCVISSMVDGVIDTGVVSFVGSPKALAAKLLGELSAPART